MLIQIISKIMPTVRKNDLRVWGVWDPVVSRLEYVSSSYSEASKILKLHKKANRAGVELLRFDLCPLYKDR